MKINLNFFFFLFFMSSFNAFSQESNEKDAFFLDLGVVIEPSTGKEKVDHLVKAPPSKVSFFLDKKPSGSVFMASTKEIALMLEDIQQKIDNAIKRQSDRDPDIWVLAIDDPRGKNYLNDFDEL